MLRALAVRIRGNGGGRGIYRFETGTGRGIPGHRGKARSSLPSARLQTALRLRPRRACPPLKQPMRLSKHGHLALGPTRYSPFDRTTTGNVAKHGCWADWVLRSNNVRVTDTKEVGVGNPAQETFCHPDARLNMIRRATVRLGRLSIRAQDLAWFFPSLLCFHFPEPAGFFSGSKAQGRRQFPALNE